MFWHLRVLHHDLSESNSTWTIPLLLLTSYIYCIRRRNRYNQDRQIAFFCHKKKSFDTCKTYLDSSNSSHLTMLNLYPQIIHDNDLSPDSVGSEIDDICNEIHAACKGFGTMKSKPITNGSLDGRSRAEGAPMTTRVFETHAHFLFPSIEQ